MDQRELVRQLEAYFRKEDEQMRRERSEIHIQREALTDEEWWDQLVEHTKAVRPQMLAIFERNKDEMIAKRPETSKSEMNYYDKQIQRKVMAILPHISFVRANLGVTGDVTQEQIDAAHRRAHIEIPSKN